MKSSLESCNYQWYIWRNNYNRFESKRNISSSHSCRRVGNDDRGDNNSGNDSENDDDDDDDYDDEEMAEK